MFCFITHGQDRISGENNKTGKHAKAGFAVEGIPRGTRRQKGQGGSAKERSGHGKAAYNGHLVNILAMSE